ncbi:hypothetical protein NKH81_25730, partial [Mesorhizobium sp. M0959]|uniref:hypothetical protein n=1 Tax=Mesorhizobium sp. M0959 TaxID=2957034 RepID=UPI003339A2A7
GDRNVTTVPWPLAPQSKRRSLSKTFCRTFSTLSRLAAAALWKQARRRRSRRLVVVAGFALELNRTRPGCATPTSCAWPVLYLSQVVRDHGSS